VLLDFATDFLRVPTLATELGDGVLQLNMGPAADDRIEGDLTDGDETFIVKQGSDANHVLVWSTLTDFDNDNMFDADEAQEYKASTAIIALGGEGNDTIDLSGVTANLTYDLEGNSGDDIIKAGSGTGTARILGGAGDDQLHGGEGNDTIFGETGEDMIYGNGGRDFLFGDGDVDDAIQNTQFNVNGAPVQGTIVTVGVKINDADDLIEGGDDEDLIFGSGGTDTILGGDHADVIIGDAGKVWVDNNRIVVTQRALDNSSDPDPDRLELAVEDTSKGNKGARDIIDGEEGNDRIYGGAGDDEILGGEHDDVIFGETGMDDIDGESGDDIIFGDFGTFKIINLMLEPVVTVGGEGDTIAGGPDNDKLLGGAGNDTIHGDNNNGTGTGEDTIWGGTGFDTLYGDGGADRLFGNADPDMLYGGSGGDILEGGQGNDVLRGGTGNDLLIAGYGSDDLDGEQDSDSYRITARGGSATELTIAYDSGGLTGTDIITLIGTPDPDTILLRAMADYYFPTLVKLVGGPGSEGLTDRILASGDPDKLRTLLQAIEDAYGPHDIPDGLVNDIIGRFTSAVGGLVITAIQNEYVADPEAPTLTELEDLVNEILASETRSKLDEIRTAIDDAYGDVPIPGTMFDAIIAAWNAFGPGLKTQIETDISNAYETELSVLGSDTDTGFVALLNNGGENVERFNYRDMEGLVVNTLAGDDYVVSDDVIASTTVNLGLGEDEVQIGQVFRSERSKDPQGETITGITAEDVYTTIEITRGWLSNGISQPMTINGGDDNDVFTVFRNVAVLNLNGGDGDDLFTVRAFALKGSTDSERARTDMKGDGGADTILYVVNAPVGIDGGDGFDTVRIVGTEFADDFVVTDSGIFGAGLNVTYVNIEKLVTDGAEGDDRFFVLSTGLEVVTEIDGGLGSDSFFVGGNPSRAPVPVISNDFRGHSGIILHNVESDDLNWEGIPVEGLSANIGDNEEDFVVVYESDGISRVTEGATSGGMGWVWDGYGVRLTRAPGPGQEVRINVVPAGMSPEDEAKGFKNLEFYAPSTGLNSPLGASLGFDPLTGVANAPTLVFNSGNWDQLQYVRFKAASDEASEGPRFVFVNHTLRNSTDPDYQSAQMLSVKVFMNDDDRDGVIITPTDRGNVVLEDGAIDAGFTDTFDVVLSQEPSNDVTVTMDILNDQVTLSDTVLTFTTGNWSTAQTITITAPEDLIVEGFHTDYISFSVSSADIDRLLDNPDPDPVADPGYNDGFIKIDGDFDLLGVQEIPVDKPTSYLLLPHRPDLSEPIAVKVNGELLSTDRFEVAGNTLSFLAEDGTPEFRTGIVEASYKYLDPGYNNTFVKDTVVDIYDEDAPTVIIEVVDDGLLDVIEEDATATDEYRVRLSRAPDQEVVVAVEAVKTRATYGRTASFEIQVNVTSAGDGTMDEFTTLTFDADNWDTWQTVTVVARPDSEFEGNDTQVFAPDLQTVNKIRGPLIIEGAAGAGSLSLPRPLMLPNELNILPPDGLVQSFVTGAGGGALETMRILATDLDGVVARLTLEDSNITDIQDLVGNTLELSSGPGTGVVLDATRPGDLFDRFWLIVEIDDTVGGGEVELTLQNPSLVDPSLTNVIAPTVETEFAITSLSVNFFADEREQIDFLFVYDNDSVANDVGTLTSSDGAVQSFDAGTNTMIVETSALQAVAKQIDPDSTDINLLLGLDLDITVGPGVGRSFTIASIGDTAESAFKELTLTPIDVGDAPTNRSEFRIEGGDTHGRITGFGMGPNILFAGRPQPGGITYGDIEVVELNLGTGDDDVTINYTTNAEDHTTLRSGDYYTQTLLNTGAGDDTVTINLDDGDDGALSVRLSEGDDTVDASGSTLPLVIFGEEGEDDITGGLGNDILFGDIGRVDYIKTVDTDTDNDGIPDTLVDEIITRLGHSEPANPVNPPVTSATATTLSDATASFATQFGGLVGLSVQAISPEGRVQFRTIVANTSDTLTIDRPWDQTPTSSYFYRVSVVPEDQTDGVFRGPRLVWSIEDAIGDDDEVYGGGGNDIVIGGAEDDILDGGADMDWVLGDDARFDFEPDAGNDGPTHLVSIVDPGTNGDDVLLGGADPDLLIGGLGDDTIDGQGSDDVLIGDDATVLFADDGITIINIETTNRTQGGMDVIYGGADDDIVIGGTNADDLDGGSGDDLIFGDNVILELDQGSGDAINPRYRELGDTTLYDAGGLVQVDIDHQARPGGNPAWADFTITLDQTTTASHFGDDYIAGGADDDTIFGQRGDDTIQGDGSITGKVDDGEPVAATRDGSLTGLPGLIEVGTLQVIPSFEDANDGDDYIEGNSGSDLIFGNLGQDDIIGGSSTFFSLDNANLRDDADDLIFGGAGTDILRNNSGDGNGRDSDVILGDNGNVYRLVSVGGATHLSFAYDDGYDEQIIVRAPQLLDYTPGGDTSDPGEPLISDIGAGDELHGESGDDFLYGQLGSDVLFGEGQDDDLIGGTGNDWISGGTGDDGVLGDDGRIYTSRNGTAEPLYGIGDLAGLTDVEISTPGNVQQAWINVADELKKTVNMTPFSTDPLWDGTTDEFGGDVPHNADDIIYGGLGSDWLHGGSGDDAMSGAEALALFYGDPINLGDVLAYSTSTGEFFLYDEFEPLLEIPGFLLNFDPSEGIARPDTEWGEVNDDGNDRLFGDLGNDWLVGGTGRDNLYGGWGNDLLNADDDHSTNDGLNDGPDTHPTYEDRAFGGAGRDRLIANTGGDRLIDWAGEFNSYIVPFAPFGIGTVSRTLQPQLADFLYDLSASDGADPTRAADTGRDPARNGEPEGELGLVRQQDFAWQAQTGGPDDLQPGNIPGGPRDVLRSANFNGQSASSTEGFFADSGSWEVSGGRLQVSAESLGGDAVSVYHIEDVLPGYFELRATISFQKPTAGWDANAFMIFDYQSPTDFKFAGIDDKINKAVVGYRDASGWHIIEQSEVQGSVRADQDYNLLLAINGTNVTLLSNNKLLIQHTFQPRVVDGYSYGLNYGLVGVGSNNARGTFDNVAVQVLPPQITFDQTEDFNGPATLVFDEQNDSQWNIVGKAYEAATTLGDSTVSLIDLQVVENINFNAYLEFETELNTTSRAGFIFDRYDDSFKFVAIDAVTDEIIIGHYTEKKGWVVGAAAAVGIAGEDGIVAGQNYTLGVALKGSTVSLSLDGQVLLGYSFNATTVDGRFGLIAIDGDAEFDDVRVKTDDRAFEGQQLLAATSADPDSDAAIDASILQPLADEAVRRLTETYALDGEKQAALADVGIAVSDLPGLVLARYNGNVIELDRDAAGHGWFVG
jgi:Ca2+-binding RTX toxin-like protein